MLARLGMFSLLQKLRHSEAPKLRRDHNSQTWENLFSFLRVLEDLVLRKPPRLPGIPDPHSARERSSTGPISLHILPEEDLRLRLGYMEMKAWNHHPSAAAGRPGHPHPAAVAEEGGEEMMMGRGGGGGGKQDENTGMKGCRATPLIQSVVQLLKEDLRVEQMDADAVAYDPTAPNAAAAAQQPKREKEIRKAARQELQFWTALQTFCDQVVPNRAASTALHAQRDRLRSMSGSSGSGISSGSFSGTLGRRKGSRIATQTLVDSGTNAAVSLFFSSSSFRFLLILFFLSSSSFFYTSFLSLSSSPSLHPFHRPNILFFDPSDVFLSSSGC